MSSTEIRVEPALVLDDQANLTPPDSQLRERAQQQVDAFVPVGATNVDKNGFVLGDTEIGAVQVAFIRTQGPEDGGIDAAGNDPNFFGGKNEFDDPVP